MNLLVPFGFYGWGNIGDEATLQGFARLVNRSPYRFRVWVGSHNPRHTARVEPSFRYFYHPFNDWTRRWANYRIAAVVVAGGTPIMDCHGDWPLDEVVPLIEAAHHRGRPIVFIGAGTERLQRKESRRIMADRVAPIVQYWTVRSEPDEARLIEYGVAPERVCVAGDMAWLLEPVSSDWGRQQLESWGVSTAGRLVGVNLMNEKPVRDRHPQLFRLIAEFLDDLVENFGVSILFLSNDVRETIGLDRAATLQTLGMMKHRDQTFLAPNEYWSPEKMMSLIANCDVTVSMRYHFCLFSALQGVPFLSLNRSDKVADLCWDLKWPFETGLDELKACDLVEKFDRIHRDSASANSLLRKQIPVLRARAETNMISLNLLQKCKEFTIC
jgi:polysaccharide pyruvyl transferase WcaK-like protein